MRMLEGDAIKLAWRLELIKASAVLADKKLLPLSMQGSNYNKFLAIIYFFFAFVIGVLFFIFYCLSRRGGNGQSELPIGFGRIAALHGEWSNRTKHLLNAVCASDPEVEAIIIIGRLNSHPKKIKALWSKKQPGSVITDLSIIEPMSKMAIFLTLLELPNLMQHGFKEVTKSNFVFNFRQQTAIVFRIFHGKVAAHWWKRQSTGLSREVIFSITGTADTTLLERAIQDSGGRTVHVVHGQATGPNFAGISDLALFRCRHDATAYKKLGCYRNCAVQPALKPVPKRGKTGILFISNLAHPMNIGFQKYGLRDELLLLNIVADAAISIGSLATPLFWKPHPVISTLPFKSQTILRSAAKKLGFIELDTSSILEEEALKSHWVISTPSTAALELLKEGILCLMLDPQGTLLDTAVSAFPIASSNASVLNKVLLRLSKPDEYTKSFISVWDKIGPACELDLNQKIHKEQ